MSHRVGNRAGSGLVRYANCWEDADVLCEALHPRQGKRILSIASGGDNSLALLAAGAEVVAVDISRPQLACLELKQAAFRCLDYASLLAFFGVRPAGDRLSAYRELRGNLTEYARCFWDARPKQIARGVVHAGRFERYFQVFRTRILPLIHRRRTVEQLLEKKGRAQRDEFYASRWDTWRWRLLFRLFFGKFVLGRLGRSPDLFRYVDGPVARRLLARARYGLTVLPAHRNPYLRYILGGNFTPALPRYLRPEFFEAVRGGLDRLTIFHGPVEAAARAGAADGFDGFNLSDIFEYLPSRVCGAIYSALLEATRPRARLAYWNMLVARSRPVQLADRLRPLTDVAQRLFERDLAFFYSALIVEEALP